MSALVTDRQIEALRALPKRLINSRARAKQQEKMVTHDYKAESLDGKRQFSIYKRQNMLLPDDFSTGIRWTGRRTELTLARYNGPSHLHRNPIEKDEILFVSHVHRATERYQVAELKPEGYAVAANYTNLDGAFRQLLSDWNIQSPETPATGSLPGGLFLPEAGEGEDDEPG